MAEESTLLAHLSANDFFFSSLGQLVVVVKIPWPGLLPEVGWAGAPNPSLDLQHPIHLFMEGAVLRGWPRAQNSHVGLLVGTLRALNLI